jgi:2-keto-4-pentenoate hydratase/2-oxohepta-3-ene-1,7-dioic acid hydratase in catechol pathway
MAYTANFKDGSVFNAPVGKVVCVGRNYAEHAKELNNPVPSEPILFIKPESSVVSLDKSFSIPAKDCHYETEVSILIGARLSKATESEVSVAIAGVGLALDLTRRDLQSKLKEKAHPWEIAKSFDGACPLTCFVPVSAFGSLQSLRFTLTINGELKQAGDSADMLNPIIPLIAYMSQFFTLKPGDIVLTGTPKGVGELHQGDLLTLVLGDQLQVETQAV